jgi:uncharacterized protein (TIGR03067 family)
MRRVIVSIAVLGLTAFAPAPFPRTERRDADAIDLQRFQGDWKAVSFDEVGPNNQRTAIGLWFKGVRVNGERWSYLSAERNEVQWFRLVLHGDRRPATIDFLRQNDVPGSPYMIGLVRREGRRVTIAYYWTPTVRAASFVDVPPKWWVLVLERED